MLAIPLSASYRPLNSFCLITSHPLSPCAPFPISPFLVLPCTLSSLQCFAWCLALCRAVPDNLIDLLVFDIFQKFVHCFKLFLSKGLLQSIIKSRLTAWYCVLGTMLDASLVVACLVESCLALPCLRGSVCLWGRRDEQCRECWRFENVGGLWWAIYTLWTLHRILQK